jgi:hypothetical protein
MPDQQLQGAGNASPTINLDAIRARYIDQLNESLPPTTAKQITHSYAELFDTKDEEQKFLIPELLPANVVTMFIGEDGIGKTQICNQLALHIAFGYTNFLGLSLNTTHKRVLIIATEDSKSKWIKAAFKQARKMEPGHDPKNVGVYFMEASIFDEFISLKDELESWLSKMKFDLIIGDAFSDIFGLIDGEINSNSDARKLISYFQHVCDKFETTMIIIHHAAKTKIVPKQREGKIFLEKNDSQGAGAITQKPRTVWALSNDPKSISPDGLSYTNYLHVVKANLMGKTYVQNALQLKFTTKDLIHRFICFVDIHLQEEAAVPVVDNTPDTRRKALPREYTREQHLEVLNVVFRDGLALPRPELLNRLVAGYGVGKAKIEASLTNGGFLAYLLENKYLEKSNWGFKFIDPERAKPPEQIEINLDNEEE